MFGNSRPGQGWASTAPQANAPRPQGPPAPYGSNPQAQAGGQTQWGAWNKGPSGLPPTLPGKDLQRPIAANGQPVSDTMPSGMIAEAYRANRYPAANLTHLLGLAPENMGPQSYTGIHGGQGYAPQGIFGALMHNSQHPLLRRF
jgi:hypothetical protein